MLDVKLSHMHYMRFNTLLAKPSSKQKAFCGTMDMALYSAHQDFTDRSQDIHVILFKKPFKFHPQGRDSKHSNWET